ncbi:CBN-MDT-30 protein [Caenorhabditis brenneri]|uniref:CBN-MDT-30 protein n=1 Tax=Caenorhabditis brenneri TaxID=135651 RepID=G0N074_CAEBE|nr:CBN-MDT-30 protein [Caenorhabditis brenneri]
MHPNQPPNYPGAPPQNPNQPYPPGSGAPGQPQQPPGYPPGGFPHFPIYQAGMPHPYMPPPATPQYPQPGASGSGGSGGGIPANFMHTQIKPEPSWSQDSRYGMPGGSSSYGYPPMGMGMNMSQQMEAQNADAPTLPFPPTPAPPQQAPSSSSQSSLLAQHLASAPLPPPGPGPGGLGGGAGGPGAAPQSHLSQLLNSTHPASFAGGMPQFQGTPEQIQHQQRMMQASIAQQNQNLMRLQQEYMASHQHSQQQQQHQQQTRAAQLQAEQAAAAAAMAATLGPATASSSSAATLAPPPQAQGFPLSGSSSQSYFTGSRAQELIFANQTIPLIARESPHQKEVDLNSFSTGELCQYGRELVNELNSKVSHLSYMLKKVMERRVLNQGENPNELAEHCQYNLSRMNEIRQIIEKRRKPNWKRMTGDEYIELMLDDSELEKPMTEERKAKREELERRFPCVMSKTPPNPGDVFYKNRWISEQLHKKYKRFDDNKEMLMSLSSQLKALSWKVDTTGPAQLRKVDQTKISKKKSDD